MEVIPLVGLHKNHTKALFEFSDLKGPSSETPISLFLSAVGVDLQSRSSES